MILDYMAAPVLSQGSSSKTGGNVNIREDVMMEAEGGVMQPQAKEFKQLGKKREQFPPSVSRRVCQHLDFAQ